MSAFSLLAFMQSTYFSRPCYTLCATRARWKQPGTCVVSTIHLRYIGSVKEGEFSWFSRWGLQCIWGDDPEYIKFLLVSQPTKGGVSQQEALNQQPGVICLGIGAVWALVVMDAGCLAISLTLVRPHVSAASSRGSRPFKGETLGRKDVFESGLPSACCLQNGTHAPCFEIEASNAECFTCSTLHPACKGRAPKRARHCNAISRSGVTAVTWLFPFPIWPRWTVLSVTRFPKLGWSP